METIRSWRELDDAVAALGGGGVHAPWVFRGLTQVDRLLATPELLPR